MNWTGGALSRSRNTNAKVSLSVKQKNYFAKARAKLQNGQRTSSPEIQYFDFGEWKPEFGVHDDRRSNSVKPRLSSQRTLDQFENVQGVVRKLKSLRPRNEGNKRKRSVINDAEGDFLPSGIPVPPISPTTTSSRPPSSSSPIQARLTAERTLKRPRPSTRSTSNDIDPLRAPDSVEAKRRKLLQETDWVGVERQKRMSKPAKIKFTDAKDRDLIGRRRPLNDSAVQNRWNVQDSRGMKIPLMTSDSEKPRSLHRDLADEYWSVNQISMRIGSIATNRGPVSDEILDRYQSPVPVQRSSHSVRKFDYDHTGPTPKSQHRRREVATPSALGEESPEPFRSLFSSEDVEQSGIAQLVEVATIADDGDLSLANDELQVPEDYRFPEPEPGFRLLFERTPQPRGQTSELHVSNDPIVRDFAFTKGQLPASVIEQPVRPEGRSVFEEQIPEYTPVEVAQLSTSPLSIATSRYMQELENQSFGSGGRKNFADNLANKTATARAQPAVNRNTAGEKRGMAGDRESKVSMQPNEVQDKENIQPTEDEDEIWRNFINLDKVDDFHSSQGQPNSTHIPHTTVIASVPKEQQIWHQASTKSNATKIPTPSRDDDEILWQNFMFGDSSPNKDEWVIEELAISECAPEIQISAYNPARSQPSMVAEAATSPVKQNPHLMDEVMLDDSTPVLNDDASRYAHASTSSIGSPGTTGDVFSNPQQVFSCPSDSPHRSSDLATDSQSHYSTDQPLPKIRNPRLSHHSSLRVEASLSPTGAINNNHPSSDELAWTPSRLPGPPSAREKVVFKKPSRYVGERANDAPEPVHLGRNVSKGKNKKKNSAEAAGRAKGKVGESGWRKSKDGRNEGYAGQEAEEETDQDDIVDD